MNFRNSWLLCCVLAGCGGLAAAPSGDAALPWLKQAPALDGRIDPAEWQDAKTFRLEKIGGEEAAMPTDVFVGRDDKMLYAGFRCHESNMNSLRRQWTTPEERDNEIWRDDCVEVGIDPFNSGLPENLRQFIVNPNGIVFDALGGHVAYHTDLRAGAFCGQDFWGVEMAIPLAEIGYQPGGAELWSMNFSRSKTAPEELSSLRSGNGGFADPSHFRPFLMAPRAGELPVVLEQVSGNEITEFVFKVADDAPQGLILAATPVALDGTAGKAVTAAAAPGETVRLKLAPPAGADYWELRLKRDSDPLYRANFPCRNRKAEKSTLAATTENPLYRELWSDQPMGLGKDGAMFWYHGGLGILMHPVALQYGFPWVERDLMKDFAQSRLLVINQSGTLERYGLIAKGREAGLKWIYMPDNRWGPGKMPKRNNSPFLFDPEAKAEYFRNLELIRPFADQIYAVSFGDEQVNYAMIILIEFLEKYPDYELLKQIDREVRAKYGYGKFGIPKSGSDPDVYAWIALRKYMNDAMVGFMKEVTAKVRAINPAIKVISDDPVAAQNQTYDYTDFTPEVCDIVTHQLYPRRNPDISDFGFLTKYVSDLSQVKEFWPCMHVEEYSCSFTPDEVIEKVSESVRSGATGIHYYLADTVGTRSGVRYLHSEYFGAPERWQIEMALLEELGRMNQLKFPEPDCAIFACLDTLRSYVGVSVYPTRTMTIHSLLELQPKVFFRYFNEGSLARKLVDLSRFKVIFAPDAKYVDRPALAALETYVKNGGTLIVTDPQAFSFTPAAEDLREVRRTLLGIADAKEADANVTAFHYADLTLPVGNAGRFVLTPTAGARTAGRYNDGSSAVVEYPLGRGKVLTFGSEIGDLGNAGNPACQQLFRYLAQSNNLKCNQDIWRFRFPSTLIRPPAMPSGRCLTGNYVKWQKFLPLTGLNREAPGAAYRYAKAPDKPAESTPQEWYALADGHLTNRLKAIAKGNVDRGKSKLDEWIVGWETPEAIAIEFDLKATYPLDRLEVICRHYLRNATLGWSEDGTRWQQAEFPLEAGDNRDPQDVRRKTYRFPAGSRGRLVKLTFASRPQAEQQRLILSEVELWSPEE